MAHIVLVGRLPFDITEDELLTVFETYGQVYDVQLLESGRAMIRYVKRESAEDAVELLHKVYSIRTGESPITVRWKEDSRPVEDDDPKNNDDKDEGNDRAGDSQHKLFVGQLPNDIKEEELAQVFSTYGSVNKIHIMRPMNSTGYRSAFIYYDTAAAGEDAIEVLDKKYKIRTDSTDAIIVKWGLDKDASSDPSGRSTTGYKLFVGNLPEDITEDEIKIVFSTYGRVNLVHVMAFNKDTQTRAALVFYARREDGEDAIAVLHDQYKIRKDAELPLRVKWGKEDQDKGRDDKEKGKEKDERHGSRGESKSSGKSSNAWQNRDWQGKKWDEAGWPNGAKEWKDDGWKWTSGDKRGSRGREDGNGSHWKSQGWSRSDNGRGTSRGWDDDKRSSSDKGKSKSKWSWDDDKGKPKGKSRHDDDNNTPSGTLYVANLPEDISEYALEYVFMKYGDVKKVQLMTGNSVKGAISALVEYDNIEDTEVAIDSLNQNYEIREGFGNIMVKHARSKRPKPY